MQLMMLIYIFLDSLTISDQAVNFGKQSSIQFWGTIVTPILNFITDIFGGHQICHVGRHILYNHLIYDV